MEREYQQDIFYNIETALNQDERLKLLEEAMYYSNEVIIDEIIGWQRQTQKDADPQEWIKTRLKPDSMWRFIHRRGYSDPYHLQVVIREGGGFLWVNLNEEHIEYFINKYKLKKL